MSTQINVTVGLGGLSDKARQLQTAARQAQLEKERQQRIEAQGQEQRTANLAATGRAADGSLLFGPSFRQPEVERRPAANRSGGGPPSILLVPEQDYVGSSIAAKVKGTKSKAFFKEYRDDYYDGFNILLVSDTFVSSGGPGGAPYIIAQNLPLRLDGYFSRVNYVAVDNSNVQGIEFEGNTLTVNKIITSAGPVDPIQIKKPAQRLEEWTIEIYILAAATGNSSGCTITLNCGVREPTSSEATEPGYPLLNMELGFPSNYPAISTHNASLAVTDPESGSWAVKFGPVNFVTNPLEPLPLLTEGSWNHFAAVRTADTINHYWNGELYRSRATNPALFGPSGTLVTDNALLYVIIEIFPGNYSPALPGWSGFRFTPKALYTEPFTPPASITSLA